MIFEKITFLLFPRVCGICKNKIIQNYTCEKCCNILKYRLKKELCVRKLNFYVDEVISLFLYKDFIREKILEFKFDGMAYIGYTFAELMLQTIIEKNINADMIVPVPIHRKRYAERGYNQSEILSKFISKKIKIKHEKNCLIKIKNNVAQSSLEMQERGKNVINVYQINNKVDICGKRILLIDDIYTTGATANECARVLKQNGAEKVICLTIAHAQ